MSRSLLAQSQLVSFWALVGIILEQQQPPSRIRRENESHHVALGVSAGRGRPCLAFLPRRSSSAQTRK